ncbi:hypothetical protein J2T05_004964 [Cupriavidus necator]|nr:hypothetical protein [Cupriavidus necator]
MCAANNLKRGARCGKLPIIHESPRRPASRLAPRQAETAAAGATRPARACQAS